MRPDLRWVQDQVDALGLKVDPIRGDSFSCQCPVHRGDGKSARFAVRNGILLFTCYAHDCSFRDMRAALDLTDGDIYAEHILRDRKRAMERRYGVTNSKARANPSEVVALTEEYIESGNRLTDQERQEYKRALLAEMRCA